MSRRGTRTDSAISPSFPRYRTRQAHTLRRPGRTVGACDSCHVNTRKWFPFASVARSGASDVRAFIDQMGKALRAGRLAKRFAGCPEWQGPYLE